MAGGGDDDDADVDRMASGCGDSSWRMRGARVPEARRCLRCSTCWSKTTTTMKILMWRVATRRWMCSR